MLRIEKVFLQGFKSFNDATELVFDPEGITAVVGPNGCGKSNVADALSWVIGEQRAKALRGGKMEDVIFQGSRNRHPSGMAEVVLTMHVYESFEIRSNEKEAKESNTATTNEKESEVSGGEPTPSLETTTETTTPTGNTGKQSRPSAMTSVRRFQQGERITVARRLYRTGESEYEMNGRTCRLRDIQDLFTGTGLGGAHYAIIEQGRIGQVLSAKPLDRRALIEEAAGISKFKMRQRAAELKLEAARNNLSRVTDIILEVDRQQNSLKRQAAKARRYQRLRTDMRELMQAVFVADYRATQQTLTELDQQKQEIAHMEDEQSSQISSLEVTRQSTFLQTEQLDAELTEARALAAQLHLTLEKSRQTASYQQSQISSLQTRQQQFSNDQVAIRERERFTLQEMERLRSELVEIEQEINEEAQSLAQAEAYFQQQSARDDQSEKELEYAQRRVTETATQCERWRQLLRQFQESVERHQKNLTGLTFEQQRAVEHTQKSSEALSVIKKQQTETEQQQARLQVEHLSIGQSLQQKEVEAEQIEAVLMGLQQQFTATEQRLRSLEELDERRAYFSEPVQAIVQASRQQSGSDIFTIIGTLADFIQVDSKDEVIIETGLRDELQYILTPSFEDALRAIDFLKREKLGRATFLVLNSKASPNGLTAEAINGSQIIRLIDLLGLKPDLRAIVQQALPRLSQTVMAEEIQQAITASISTNGKGHSFLTPTGEFISAGHIISGGSTTETGTGILALKREIDSLRNESIRMAAEVATVEARSEEIKRERQTLAEVNSTLDKQLRDIEKEILLLQGQHQQCEREHERANTHLRIVTAEIAQSEQELTEASSKHQHAEAELQLASETYAAAETLAQQAQEGVIEVRRLASERTHEISRRRADFAAKSERRKGLQNDIRRLESEAQDITRRLSRSQLEAIEVEGQIQSLTESNLVLQAEIENYEQQWQGQTGEVETRQMQFAQIKEELLTLETEVARLREVLSQMRENRTAIDITRTRLLTNLEHLAITCHTELGEPLAALLEKDINVTATPPHAVSKESGEEDDEEKELIDLDETFPHTFAATPQEFDLELAKERLLELRNKVENMGPVNLLALEELGEAEDRLGFLLEQKADIEKAVADTQEVIAELKRRSRERFTDAFHHINKNFSEMFLELFGGGHGEMRLIDESDVLESGIDIIAQPPGKRLQNVLLLSGGEKAMAAMALVLGIFKYRPSPFCLLDEVDAPLDEVNIGRFSDKIVEMSQNTQFLIITHSKRTMEAARTLYGVTMEDPGVSKLISVRLT